MKVDNNISFGSSFKPIVSLNKGRWAEIVPEFAKATKDSSGGLYLLENKSPKGKIRYVLALKSSRPEVLAENVVGIPNELLGKWMVELQNGDIVKKLEKVFKILKVRKQAIYDIRKLSGQQPVRQEIIADRYLKRLRKFADNDPDLLVLNRDPYNKSVSVWYSPMEAKREMYALLDCNDGRKVIATV